MHIRYGFGLIQKDIHNISTREFPALDNLMEKQSEIIDLIIKRSGNSTEAIKGGIKTIKDANYRIIKLILKQAAQIPKASPSDLMSGPNFKQMQSPRCSKNQVSIFGGLFEFNHVSYINDENTFSISVVLKSNCNLIKDNKIFLTLVRPVSQH